MTCAPWTLGDGCCTDWDTFDPATQGRAEYMAWETLRLLTSGMVGTCPTMFRPCVSAPCDICHSGYLQRWAPPPPYMDNGVRCGGQGCSCPELSEVILPGKVAQVTSVMEDGIELDPSMYRLDGNRLIRTDDDVFPACQDMRLSPDAVGAFTVTYVPGVVPGPGGEFAAGVLACEFAKACTTGKCRLPSSVVSVARQGVAMQFSQGMYPDGLTGIREVDAYILTVNPNSLKVPPMVWSPDTGSGRATGMVVP